MEESAVIHIDLEPTWKALLHMVSRGMLSAEELYPAVELADFVRQAQKAGHKKVIITLRESSIDMDVE